MMELNGLDPIRTNIKELKHRCYKLLNARMMTMEEFNEKMSRLNEIEEEL